MNKKCLRIIFLYIISKFILLNLIYITSMPPKAPPFVLNKKLIIHIDLKDILILHSDKSAKDQYVYQIIASCAWGKLQKKDEKSPLLWRLVYPTLSRTIPQGDSTLISYKSYTESLFPKVGNQSQEKIKEIERNRVDMYNNFVKGPGSKLKGQIDKIFKNITIAKPLHDHIKSELDSKDEQQSQHYRKLLSILELGKYQILPGFFKLVLYLKKAKRQFGFVFHGVHQLNHDDIINQLNLFFSGQHPLYNGKNSTPLIKLDGSKGIKNFKIQNKNTCEFYRFQKQFIDDYATFGTRKIYKQKDIEGLKHKLLQMKIQTKLVKSSEIYTYSHLLLKQSASIYAIDNFHFMMIDPVDYNTHQIYFATNNVKIKVITCLGQEISNTNQKMTVNVDIYDVLKDLDYFIKIVEICQKNRSIQIQKIQKGINNQQQKKKQKVLGSGLSDTQYLQQTILPILEGALRLVDIQRPEDPLAVIALYCLKNKHRIKLSSS